MQAVMAAQVRIENVVLMEDSRHFPGASLVKHVFPYPLCDGTK